MHLAAASCWTHGVLYLEIQKVYAAIYPVQRRRRRCHVVLATAKLQVARPILEPSWRMYQAVPATAKG